MPRSKPVTRFLLSAFVCLPIHGAAFAQVSNGVTADPSVEEVSYGSFDGLSTVETWRRIDTVD